MTDYPQVVPIKAEESGKAKYHHPHLMDVGVGVKGEGECLLMISPRQTGKSTIISNLFLNDNFYGQTFFDDVIVISPTINLDRSSRFMKQRFQTYDQYSPDIIDNLLAKQMSYEEDERPEIALVLDDMVGIMDKTIANLVTRSRHYNIKLLIISVQKFRGSVDPIIRANATSVIVGSPFPNQRELNAIAEEYGDIFNGPKNWLKLYKKATPKRYDFAFMKMSNPPVMYKNFEKVIGTGGEQESVEMDIEKNEENID